MGKQELYNIEVIGLGNEKHTFDFVIDAVFFASFASDIIEKGNLKVNITIEKSETMIQTSLSAEGWVELACDRTLEKFNFDVKFEKPLFFKYGDTFEELSEDVIRIPSNLEAINFAQYIYEYIILSLPTKRLHPKFASEDETLEDEIVFYSEEENEEQQENQTDVRWAALKNLKFK